MCIKAETTATTCTMTLTARTIINNFTCGRVDTYGATTLWLLIAMLSPKDSRERTARRAFQHHGGTILTSTRWRIEPAGKQRAERIRLPALCDSIEAALTS